MTKKLFDEEPLVPRSEPPGWVVDELVNTHGMNRSKVRTMSARQAFGALYGCRERAARQRQTREERKAEVVRVLVSVDPEKLTETEIHDAVNEALAHLTADQLVRVARGLVPLMK